ncbi:uncharacterized protein TNCV_2471211 [Trichonephila clavipes]|nr:uncharacterized protein TNCV_2471211 [Trichonephila clavipes]
METGWSSRGIAPQLGRFHCVVRRCWGQWNPEISFKGRPGTGRLRQTSRREACRIIRNAQVQPTASSATIQAQVAPSLGPLCLLEPYEGAWLKDIWDHGAHYMSCP